MKSILIPTDLSPASHNATAYALELAQEFNASVTLLMATPLGIMMDDSMLAPIMVTQAEILDQNRQKLKTEADKFSGSSTVEIKAFVLEGEPSNLIINMAKENNHDLLIMGTKGKGNSNSFFGSTTTGVINKSDLPVLVIPESAKYEPVKNITLASDFESITDFASYKSLMDIAEKFESKISIINILENESDLSNSQAMEKMNLSQLFSKFRNDFYSIDNSNVEEGINDFIENNPTQILAMIARKHNFFARLLGMEHTTKMSYKIKIPLLIVHPV